MSGCTRFLSQAFVYILTPLSCSSLSDCKGAYQLTTHNVYNETLVGCNGLYVPRLSLSTVNYPTLHASRASCKLDWLFAVACIVMEGAGCNALDPGLAIMQETPSILQQIRPLYMIGFSHCQDSKPRQPTTEDVYRGCVICETPAQWKQFIVGDWRHGYFAQPGAACAFSVKMIRCLPES